MPGGWLVCEDMDERPPVAADGSDPPRTSGARLSDRRAISSATPAGAGAYGSQSMGNELPVEQLSPQRCQILKDENAKKFQKTFQKLNFFTYANISVELF